MEVTSNRMKQQFAFMVGVAVNEGVKSLGCVPGTAVGE